MAVTGWKLDQADRDRLLLRFPPEWPDVIADHVTLDAKASRGAPPPPAVDAAIVGQVSDGEGLQALVVAIDGRTDRPDGSTYHITWSLDRQRGRKPVDSNAVLAERGWEVMDERIAVRLSPARWP